MVLSYDDVVIVFFFKAKYKNENDKVSPITNSQCGWIARGWGVHLLIMNRLFLDLAYDFQLLNRLSGSFS